MRINPNRNITIAADKIGTKTIDLVEGQEREVDDVLGNLWISQGFATEVSSKVKSEEKQDKPQVEDKKDKSELEDKSASKGKKEDK